MGKGYQLSVLVLIGLLWAGPVKISCQDSVATAPTSESTAQHYGRNKPAKLSAKIVSVTVFRDRARVSRRAVISLAKGEQYLLFDNLPTQIEDNSVELAGNGDFFIKNITLTTQRKLKKIPARKKELDEQKKSWQEKIDEYNDTINQARNEKKFIDQIVKKITSSNGKDSLTELNPQGWIKMVTFTRTKNEAVDKEIRDTKRLIEATREKIKKIDKELSKIRFQFNQKKKQIEVVVICQKSGKIQLDLAYLVDDAYWFPVYDFRVSTKTKQTTLIYNALIAQETDEEWKNVNLKLSTAIPNLSTTHPELKPWRLNFYQPIPRKSIQQQLLKGREQVAGENVFMPKEKKSEGEESSRQMATVMAPDSEASWAIDGVNTTRFRAATIGSQATTTVFVLQGKNTIINNATEQKVAIMSHKFPAYFRYSTVPKLSPNAFLKAKIKNSSPYPILASEASLYLDNSYIGTTHVPDLAPGAEDWFFFGRDEGIKVTYKFFKELADKKGTFNKKNQRVFESLISVKNNKKEKIEIVIWDQLPLPSHADIKVELLEPEYRTSMAHLKKNKYNLLEWIYTLEPGKKVEIPLKFSVTYPKDKTIKF